MLPSVRLDSGGHGRNNERSSPTNEIDVASITLLHDRVQIKLQECTQSTSGTKAMADYRKLERLKQRLNARQFQDLAVPIEVVGSSQVRRDFVVLLAF